MRSPGQPALLQPERSAPLGEMAAFGGGALNGRVPPLGCHPPGVTWRPPGVPAPLLPLGEKVLSGGLQMAFSGVPSSRWGLEMPRRARPSPSRRVRPPPGGGKWPPAPVSGRSASCACAVPPSRAGRGCHGAAPEAERGRGSASGRGGAAAGFASPPRRGWKWRPGGGSAARRRPDTPPAAPRPPAPPGPPSAPTSHAHPRPACGTPRHGAQAHTWPCQVGTGAAPPSPHSPQWGQALAPPLHRPPHHHPLPLQGPAWGGRASAAPEPPGPSRQGQRLHGQDRPPALQPSPRPCPALPGSWCAFLLQSAGSRSDQRSRRDTSAGESEPVLGVTAGWALPEGLLGQGASAGLPQPQASGGRGLRAAEQRGSFGPACHAPGKASVPRLPPPQARAEMNAGLVLFFPSSSGQGRVGSYWPESWPAWNWTQPH